MRTLEQQGKNVDDAISKALEELNVSRDQISVEILEEGSRGLFGLMGARPAKIRVRVAQDASYDAIKEELRSVPTPEAKEATPQEKKAEESRPRKQQTPRAKGRPQQQRNNGEGQKGRAKDKPKDRAKGGSRDQAKGEAKARSKDGARDQAKGEAKAGAKDRVKENSRPQKKEVQKEQVKDVAPKERAKESPKEYDEKDIQQIIDKAKESLSVILANLQVEYKVEVKRRDDQILMNIHCDNENFLIGRRGTTLDAVQYLVNRIANKDIEEKIQVVLDTSDYRVNRKQRLEKLALRLSKRVKTTGKSVTVAPMNPHDRRIIHLTLQDDTSIRTLSRGTGFMRRIIISSNRSAKHRKSAPPSAE